MGKVLVKVFGTLRLELGLGEIQLDLPEPRPLREVLEAVVSFLKEEGEKSFKRKLLEESEELKRGVIILKNGVNVLHLQGLDTVIEPGDTLSVFPPGAGG